jgi:flavodoxin
MDTLILYDSPFGNTARVARAMAAELEARGPVRLASVADPAALDLTDVGLLVVGGPTHLHGMSPAMRQFLDGLPRDRLRGMAVATFDTRYRMPWLLSGSAARGIQRALARRGGRSIAPPASFFIVRDIPPPGQKRRHDREHLESGELERAAVWASRLSPTLTPATRSASQHHA